MSSPLPEYTKPPISYNNPPSLITFTLTILILCFVAFTIAYLCKYCFSSIIQTWTLTRTVSGSLVRLSPERSPPRGLNPTLLEGFPTFTYASVKDLRKEKSYSLECAICLLEFEDDSMLRHLTICCHVFHQECIDLWLRSHKTCPVCRTNLESSPPNQMPKLGDDDNNNYNNNVAQEGVVSLRNDDIRIDVREEEIEIIVDERHEREHHQMSVSNMQQQQQHQQQEENRFSRSHSTGHSIVMIRGEERDDDKYTLRLPEHVIRRGHNSTKSCVNYNEIKGPPPCSNCGFVQPATSSSSVAHAQES